MARNVQVSDRPLFRVLSEEKMYELHLATLEVLEKTGVEIYHNEAVALLKEAGCFVQDPHRVRIPSHLVRQAIDTAPERIAIRDRDGDSAMFLEGHNVYFGTGSDCPNIIDLETHRRRPSGLQDVADLAKVTDAAAEIDFVMSMALAQDKPARTADVHQFVAMANNTTKPIVFTAFSLESLRTIHEICAVIAGDEETFRRVPFVVHYSEPTSPLRHTKEATEKLLYCAEHRIPIVYTSGIMAGSSSPSTLAGTIVQANAEGLSGLVVSQLKQPGAPFVYGAFITIMDMHSALFSYGAPELHLMSAAMADLAHFYRLPAWSQAGITDAKILDLQGAVESTASCLMAALSGANLVHDIGYLESGLTSSFESILLCDEIVGLTRRILRGIDVTQDSLAVDIIDRVGPGGSFLPEQHTLTHFRNQFWFPERFDRNRFDKWNSLGGKPLFEKLNEEAKQILREHHPERIPSDQMAEIQRIVARAEEASTV